MPRLCCKTAGGTLGISTGTGKSGGQAEDAAKIGKNMKWLQSIDGFPALVSDPWLNGRLTTIHACSDLWASGADVKSAMTTVILPMIESEEQKNC